MTTLLDVVRLSTRHLEGRGCDTPRLDAELLAAHALGLRRLDLYLQHDRPLDDADLAPIRALLRRRAAGEPVAYLVGAREFYGRRFEVTPDVLIPRPETELVVERALGWARSRAGAAGEGLRIADLGTGSGCIAVTLALELPGAEVVAVDLAPKALAVAGENARRLGAGERVRLVEGSWLEPLGDRPGLDLVVANPPYVAEPEVAGLMSEVRDHEPRLALVAGPDGMDAYAAIATGLAAALAPGGAVVVEVDPRRAAAVAGLLAACLEGATVTTSRDLAGHDRTVEAILPPPA